MDITGDTAALTEIQVAWGEDTRCSTCLCGLPAGATAFGDGDGHMCGDCAQDGGEFSYEEWIGQRVRAARALKAVEQESVRMIEAACRDTTHVLTGKA
jgi:hypothetical protein